MGKQQVDLSVWLERRMMKQIIRGRGTHVREIDLKLKDFGYYAKKKFVSKLISTSEAVEFFESKDETQS